MDVIIDADCASIPVDAELLTSQGSLALNLLARLNYDPLNPPVADLLASAHHLDGDWLVVTPIHWEASHNDALIVAAGQSLNLEETEAKYWFESLSTFLAGEGMTLYYCDKDTWLLSNPARPAIHAKPVFQIINHSLMPELAQLDASMYWQKFFTECQMFFASQPNTSPVNGVWIWGGAKLGAKKSVSICADENSLSLAQVCTKEVTPYDLDIELKKFQILLMNHIDNLSLKHQTEISQISARWYWNNSAYKTRSLNWFTRIWRSLIHAH
jgi:hypothetical protein